MTTTDRDSLKAGAWTSLWTFLGMASLGLVGWLQDVQEWASSNGAADFPDLDALGYLLVAAVVAAVSGLIGTIVRLAQGHGVMPGQPPAYKR